MGVERDQPLRDRERAGDVSRGELTLRLSPQLRLGRCEREQLSSEIARALGLVGRRLQRGRAIEELHQRAASYAMPGEAVDGQDVVAVRDAMDRAAARARADGTPTLLEIRTYRYVGHSMSDAAHGTYRAKEEVEEHKRRDPIRLLAELLRERAGLVEAEVDEMEAAVKAEVQDAWDFAEQSPDPDPAALFTDVHAPEA